MLQVRDLDVHYGRAHALQGVSLDVGAAPLAVVGRNGMGKSTLCQALMGLVPASGGSVSFDGKAVTGLPPHRVARAGLALVPQGRRTFASLSVDEHLKLFGRGQGRRDRGRQGRGGDSGARWSVERVYQTFPRLAERRRNGGTQLSGGEQQMLAIARALLLEPRLVIMDEPSEGLAPVIVDHLIGVLRALPGEGIGLLLVEQNFRVATEVCPEVAVMVNGRVAARMPSAQLAADPELQRRYLGVAKGGH